MVTANIIGRALQLKIAAIIIGKAVQLKKAITGTMAITTFSAIKLLDNCVLNKAVKFYQT